MNLSEERITTIEKQKSKIRDRYKGDSPELIKLIPAKEETSIFDDSTQLRVAVYARVSTGDPRQTSGTSLKHRDQFKLMIEHCRKGMIDLNNMKEQTFS